MSQTYLPRKAVLCLCGTPYVRITFGSVTRYNGYRYLLDWEDEAVFSTCPKCEHRLDESTHEVQIEEVEIERV